VFKIVNRIIREITCHSGGIIRGKIVLVLPTFIRKYWGILLFFILEPPMASARAVITIELSPQAGRPNYNYNIVQSPPAEGINRVVSPSSSINNIHQIQNYLSDPHVMFCRSTTFSALFTSHES
jgi:hypothetical protein